MTAIDVSPVIGNPDTDDDEGLSHIVCCLTPDGACGVPTLCGEGSTNITEGELDEYTAEDDCAACRLVAAVDPSYCPEFGHCRG